MHRLKHHGSHYQTLLCNHRNQAVKKKSPLNKCTYITHSPFLSLSFLSFPPSSQVQQQLRASPCTAPALCCILPCNPSSSSVPVPAASTPPPRLCAVSLTPPFTPGSLFHLFAYWGWKSICFIHTTFCRTLISSASSLSRPSLHCACLQPVLTIHEFDIFFLH